MHKIQQNNVVLGSGNVFLLMQCYAGISIECQYLNLSVFFYYFAFYSLGACQSFIISLHSTKLKKIFL